MSYVTDLQTPTVHACMGYHTELRMEVTNVILCGLLRLGCAQEVQISIAGPKI
jgi:hypothetical protein